MGAATGALPGEAMRRRMIALVDRAERYLKRAKAWLLPASTKQRADDVPRAEIAALPPALRTLDAPPDYPVAFSPALLARQEAAVAAVRRREGL